MPPETMSEAVSRSESKQAVEVDIASAFKVRPPRFEPEDVIAALIDLWLDPEYRWLHAPFWSAFAWRRSRPWLPEANDDIKAAVAAAIDTAIHLYPLASREVLDNARKHWRSSREAPQAGFEFRKLQFEVLHEAVVTAVTPLAAVEFDHGALSHERENSCFERSHPRDVLTRHAENVYLSYIALRETGSTADPW